MIIDYKPAIEALENARLAISTLCNSFDEGVVRESEGNFYQAGFTRGWNLSLVSNFRSVLWHMGDTLEHMDEKQKTNEGE